MEAVNEHTSIKRTRQAMTFVGFSGVSVSLLCEA